jgi:hypothetical protein
MQDANYCDGAGTRTWCCPNSQPQPVCGWYNYNRGFCAAACPAGYTETASLSNGCKATYTYQAGCCEVEDHTALTNPRESMALYNQCEWAGTSYYCSTKCDSASGFSLFVSSWAGSGAVMCEVNQVKHISFGCYDTFQFRPCCCNHPAQRRHGEIAISTTTKMASRAQRT